MDKGQSCILLILGHWGDGPVTSLEECTWNEIRRISTLDVRRSALKYRDSIRAYSPNPNFGNVSRLVLVAWYSSSCALQRDPSVPTLLPEAHELKLICCCRGV